MVERIDATDFLRRFIPRRIDLDCDFGLDMLVTQNPQVSSHLSSASRDYPRSNEQQGARPQRRAQRKANQQTQNKSARKTLELLEYIMPQNRRIYNFGVKTLKPRPIGMLPESTLESDDCSRSE